MTAAPSSDHERAFRIAVRAGGGLVVRRGADDGIRVLVVHRPVRNDWSFPKGKQHRAETLLEAALREVREETGLFCVAEAIVGTTEYVDRSQRPKLVRYWAMHPLTGTFEPSDEVDAVAWLRPTEALVRLTQPRECDLLDSAVPLLTSVLDRRDEVRALSSG
jgi:8-oxo-dGTP diphosphatase